MSKDSSGKATFFQTLQDISQSIESGKALMPESILLNFKLMPMKYVRNLKA